MEPLLNTLRHDPSIEVRAAVAQDLGRIGTPNAIPVPLDALSDDLEVADSAADALVDLGAMSIAPVLDALTSPNWSVRAFAAAVLGRLRATTAVAPLIKALSDEHWCVRTFAAQALGEIGDSRATRSLITCLHEWAPGGAILYGACTWLDWWPRGGCRTGCELAQF